MSGTAEAPGGAGRPNEGTAPDDGADRTGVTAAQSRGEAAAPPRAGAENAARETGAKGAAPPLQPGRPSADDVGGHGMPATATAGDANAAVGDAERPDGPEMAPGGEAAADAGADDGAGRAEPGASGAEPAEDGDEGAAEAPDPALLAEGARIAEALIFASDRPVTPAMLGAVLPPGVTAGAVVAALAAACESRGVTIAEVAGGWAFRTAPDLAQRLTKVVQAPRRLPRAAMEALSIIAYHQPCTRGEIEEIRGAALAQTTLEALLELGLVAPRGRREVPGRPTLWGTTPKFLEQFGLKGLTDLPRKEELVTAETGPALPLAEAAPEPEAEAAAAEDAAPTEADSAPGAAPGA